MKLLFTQWVENQGGADAVGKKVGLTGSAVRYWLRGENPPDYPIILKLMKLSKGTLTFESIFKECTRNKKDRSKKV